MPHSLAQKLHESQERCSEPFMQQLKVQREMQLMEQRCVDVMVPRRPEVRLAPVAVPPIHCRNRPRHSVPCGRQERVPTLAGRVQAEPREV